MLFYSMRRGQIAPAGVFGRCWLLVVLLLYIAPCLVQGLSKELVVSYHTCIAGEGCHMVGEKSFHDSHVLLLTSANYQQKLQGRLINIEIECSGSRSIDTAATLDKPSLSKKKQYRQEIGLVQCGQCPLSEMIQEAERIGVDGIVIGNTNECGRPTKELLESATNSRVPVAFVASEVVSEIETMQEQIIALNEPHPEDVRHDAFIYLSIYNGKPDHESHVVNHILASTHILLATMVILALLIYLSLACSVGSLRYIPREIAPDIFGTRPEPVDKGTLEQLPLIPVKWNVGGFGDGDEEARCESPSTMELGQTRKALLQQLAGIIVRSGDGSYLFTEEKECAICLDSYVFNDSLRLLPCKHAFHRKCIDAWLLSESMTVHCPVCKSSIIDGLRLLDKHGYSDVLNLLHGNSCVAGHCWYTKPARVLPLYFYRAFCDSIARLWNRGQ